MTDEYERCFDEYIAPVICSKCGSGMLTIRKYDKNGAVAWRCDDCGETQQLPKLANLKRRKEGQTWARDVFREGGNRCRICGSTVGLHAHHLIPFKECKEKYPELLTAPGNGVVVCVECHRKIHGKDARRSAELRP